MEQICCLFERYGIADAEEKVRCYIHARIALLICKQRNMTTNADSNAGPVCRKIAGNGRKYRFAADRRLQIELDLVVQDENPGGTPFSICVENGNGFHVSYRKIRKEEL